MRKLLLIEPGRVWRLAALGAIVASFLLPMSAQAATPAGCAAAGKISRPQGQDAGQRDQSAYSGL